MTAVEERPRLIAPKRIPHGLMSLADMFNTHLAKVYHLRGCLEHLSNIVHIKSNGKQARSELEKEEKQSFCSFLLDVREIAIEYEWQAVQDRVDICEYKLKKEMTLVDLEYELIVFNETIYKSMKRDLVYRYPRQKWNILENWKTEWAAALEKFPSAYDDIFSAVDCWAMNHSTAAAFHAMRVLEHGLRALANHLNVSYDTKQWYNIINEIESEIRKRSNLPRAEKKGEILKFLSEAAKEFSYFKDGWRNYVVHARITYDEHQSRSVLEHVRTFMNILASELGEKVCSDV